MPTRREGENRAAFINRCMADTKMNRDFPDRQQRYAVCLSYADKTASRHDPRSTPAPKKDRIKGSPRNKPGSAKPGGSVTFSQKVTNSLKEKVKNHNAKSDRKVTLRMLKAVYRRGAGAYSTSHRPGVSRAAWSMARVNAFLRLVRSGRPANPKYVQDNDLLPRGHPRKGSGKKD